MFSSYKMTKAKRIENQAACPQPIPFASQHLEDGLWYYLLKYAAANLHSLQNQTQSKFDNMMENMMSRCDQTCLEDTCSIQPTNIFS